MTLIQVVSQLNSSCGPYLASVILVQKISLEFQVIMRVSCKRVSWWSRVEASTPLTAKSYSTFYSNQRKGFKITVFTFPISFNVTDLTNTLRYLLVI